ncbi:MAG: hypothetical protein PHE43_04255 [Candidatus Nanoarchaeia archaeon]|nr:hypothetical protein [Candidatus Nanoarchaeia archaeon]
MGTDRKFEKNKVRVYCAGCGKSYFEFEAENVRNIDGNLKTPRENWYDRGEWYEGDRDESGNGISLICGKCQNIREKEELQTKKRRAEEELEKINKKIKKESL